MLTTTHAWHYAQVVRRPYMFWYDTEMDTVERGIMNLAAAKVELVEGLESVDDVSSSAIITPHRYL